MRSQQRSLTGFLPSGLLCVALAAAAFTAPAYAQDGQAGAAPGGQHRGPGGAGGFANMPRIQGEVTAVSAPTVTVKAEDGTITTIVTTDNTRIMHSQATAGGGTPGSGGPGGPAGGGPGMGRSMMGNMQPIKVADIHVGDGLMAAGQMDPGTKQLHAMFAVVTDASVVKALKENMGKTYISGKVTAIDLDNARLTVARADGVTQTIGLDESTSFHRGGGGRHGGGDQAAAAPSAGAESITLADVKVGDNILGQGALKNGTFVPKDLTVMSPHQRGEGGGAPPAQ